MSLLLEKFTFHPQMLFSPETDGDGDGGGSGTDDQNEDDQGGDNSDDGGMINKDDILGKKDDAGEDRTDKDEAKDDEKKVAERPDFIKEKFWDAEKGEPRLDAMAKAYDDLEKKLGSTAKAPDEYKIEIGEDLKGIFHEENAEKDPLLNWFKGYAKENNFSQEQFNDALNGFGKSATDFLQGDGAIPAAPDPKEEREKLGKNAGAIIQDQTRFLEQMFKQGHVNEEQMGEILILTETAAGLQALQAVRNYYGDQQKIPQNLNPGGGAKSGDELRKMQADDKYGSDPEYTAMVDKEYEKKYGTGTSGESLRSSL